MRIRRMVCVGVILFLAGGVPVITPAEDGKHWPGFRGSDPAGVAGDVNLPEHWSAGENVAWSVEVPGRGWSSPILWGHRIFVTSAVTTGNYKEPSTGIYGNDFVAELTRQGLSPEEVMARVKARDIESAAETELVRWMVYCLDQNDGRVLWEREAHRGKPHGGRHRKNTYASETPVTDGERVYAYFGNVGLYAYSMDGEQLWSHHWDPKAIYLDFGTASSPALDGDRIYVQNDNEQSSFLAALDKRTGKEIWKVERSFGGGRGSGWSTPYVWRNSLRTEIVTVGKGRAVSYDTDGKELWHLTGLAGQATPTPVADAGLLYVGTGAQTGNNRPLFAVRPGASGDISLKQDETSNDYVAWFQKSATPYIPSLLLYKNRIYALLDNGILGVYDARSGTQVYRARVGAGASSFSSSPWAYRDRIFFLSEDGDTFVIKAGDEFAEVAVNRLDEMSLASPAISEDGLFIRTATHLHRIVKK